ncbi:filamin-A isoform X2 [Octopus sinensis]|uniref:Filamin-A isoform X2 n=1 Tax=Octopus sinensis TaxID=2607531 RepID=A0A7E6FGP0_9MOLL|nr:filamin-A isoform X2 [Octopus sinensis]
MASQSEAYYDDDEDYDEDDEDMPATERDLADDAQWKLIQKNTFTRWANEHLKTVSKQLMDLETDLSDGLRLIALVEVLSSKKFKFINKKPNFRTQKLENVTRVLKFLEEDEGIRIVNIDSGDIVDQKLKLILGLIWTLILHYSISMPMWEGEEPAPGAGGPTPKQRLLNWIQGKCGDLPINNFTTDWNDGRAIGALVDACGPGLCPDWADWAPKNKLKNAKEAMEAAEKWLDVPQLIKPAEMNNPKIDEMSMMTYLSQFPNCKLNPQAPLRPRLNPNRVRAYGPGIEPTGNTKGAKTSFTVETFSAGQGTLEPLVLNPKGQKEPCEVVFNQDKHLTYTCTYTPKVEGSYKVIIKYSGKEIPKSPFPVAVSAPAGDPSKVKAAGPGLEPGNVVSVVTHFTISLKDAGEGPVGVVITDPSGNQNAIKPKMTRQPDGTYHVEYTPKVPGVHTISIVFCGQPIPRSPISVTISTASNAKKCYATGRGIQPKGIRVKDNADFKVYTKGAGDGDMKVTITGPGNANEPVSIKKLDPTTYECVYTPKQPGTYTINVTFGGQHIPKSPFKVEVGPFKLSKIIAYGPGLHGGMVGKPATFVVETHGETGALGFSIEGPSQAKIDCKDNGDGTADITYWPTAPGEYAVHIHCNEEDIPKSPYMAQIQPATKDFDPLKVVAFGPGLQETGVQVQQMTEFTVDAKKAGKAQLDIICHDADGNPVKVDIKDNKDGTYTCKYKPLKNVKHVVLISYGGVNIPKSPFRVFVQSPSSVKVYGPGVKPGVKTNQPTHFVVDCKEAGPGDVAISLTDERGMDVPVNTVDNQDGTFTVNYEAKIPGMYTINVYFADKEIPASPIKVKVESSIDIGKVRVEGLEKTQEVGKEKMIDIITVGAGKAEATVQITNPKGVKTTVPTKPMANGHSAPILFKEPGPHKVEVSYGGMPAKGSPFKVDAVVPVSANNVHAYGPGLKEGTAKKPATFTVDRRAAPPGALGVSVEGPSEAKVNCTDNKDGTVNAEYFPTVPGDYKVNVIYDNAPIPGSPFKAKIQPATLDVGGIKAYGPGVEKTGVFLDAPANFTVDATPVTTNGDGKVRAVVTSPSGAKAELPIDNKKNGIYTGSYMPIEQGPYAVDISYENMPIPGSPFKTTAVPGCDPSKVKAYGPGLERGITNKPNVFTVDSRGAGHGNLGLSIDGPVEAKMTCKDNHDGTCQVEYMPLKSGPYDIGVKYGDKHIPGSPFHVPVETPVDPSKVKCQGPGVDTAKGVKPKEPTSFTIDTKEAGDAPLEVTVTDKFGKRPADVHPIEEGVFKANYTVPEEGPCQLDVKYANQHVPKSPFNMPVKPGFDPTKVRVYGPGVNDVPASLPVSFCIDTTEAGIADLEVSIQRPDGTFVKPIIHDNGDGTFNVTYTPEDLGVYTIKIKFGGVEIPTSPIKACSKPTGDASKCKITKGTEKTVMVKKETVITVDASQAGTGKVTCRIRDSNGHDIDIDIIENPDETFSIQFTPQFPGTYSISIQFGGQSIPDGKYQVEAVDSADYEVYLETKEKVLCPQPVVDDIIKPVKVDEVQSAPAPYHPLDFCIPVGPVFNFVSGHIITPSGKKVYPKIEDNKNGTVGVRYQPTEAGLHELHIQYNNEPVYGSPFHFHVDAINSGQVTAHGPGLTHGVVNESAVFTIVTKDAGAGGLSLSIEGPSKATINCVDNKDGTCTVSYMPTAPGEYCITVKFADSNISGSPFKPKITPSEPRRRAQISVGSSSEVSLKVTETDITNLTAMIKTPSGKEEPCILKKLSNGHLGISFTPHEVGEHLVNVYRNGQHIASSPFRIYVGEGELGNAGKVKVTGRGIVEGMANQVNEFTVNTKEAGYGGLSLSIEGPSKADIECKDNDDGTCGVTYKPTEPGTYIINIKFADVHVPGSPFSVKIGGEPSSRITERITRHREAADITHIGSQCELSLKIPGTSPFDMTASVTSPSGVTEVCDVISLNDCHYSIKFVPKEMGVHTVSVKHKDMHIPGSPFEFTVGPITGGGAHKVHAAGPGLEKGEVHSPCEFNIYTREAGAGGLSIAVEGPSKAEIDFEDRKDGSCGVNYVCTEPGEYLVSVKFNDEHIPESPFRVAISPSVGDAQKLSVHSLQEKGLQVNKPAVFKVSFNGAHGKLLAKVVSPSGVEDDALVNEINEGEYAVSFIPKENGTHLVHVTFDGCHIPGSPFRVLVGKVDADPGRVTAYGEGLYQGRTRQVAKFIISTVNAGSGALAVTVEGPSKVKLDCREVEEGYEFSYTPTAPGDYLINIRYGGVGIAGSPFKAKITGDGHASGFHEQASVVVETVTKTSTTTRFSGVQQYQSDPSKVVARGNGLNSAVRGKANTFTIDTTNAGVNIMFVGMRGPKGPCEELVVKHLGNNQYNVSYLVQEVGEYMLMVKWGDDHIPGSPFCVKVQ